MTTDQNEWFRSLNAGLPDDVARLKAAGYYEEAVARIDALLAEGWTTDEIEEVLYGCGGEDLRCLY